MRLKINVQHADACFAAEELRSENREAELGNLKQTRFEQYACMNPSFNVVSSCYLFRAKSRLLERGYDAVDIDNRDFNRASFHKTSKIIRCALFTQGLIQPLHLQFRDLLMLQYQASAQYP